MSSNPQCLFCRIVNGEVPAKKVFEGEDIIAFQDITPQAPTHVLVIPKRHIASIGDMTEDDAAIVGQTVLQASKLARTLKVDLEGYRLVVNNGPGAGQTVFHIHIHLLGGRHFGWPPG